MLDDIRGFFMMVLYSLVDTRVARAVLGSSIIIVVSVFSLRLFGGYINAPRPTIYITSPKADAELTDKQVLVKGRVFPGDSVVTVNGQNVVANGDGTFSQVVNLSAGMNVLKFEATFYGRKSGAIQTAMRTLTEEEKAEQTAALLKEQNKVKSAADQLALLQKPPDVLAAETTPPPQATSSASSADSAEQYKEPLKDMIQSQSIVRNGEENIITGQFKNATDKTLRWVKIRAEYIDTSGTVVDTKVGAITRVDEHLAPGTMVEYTIPASTTAYSTYRITVAYEAL